AGPATRARVRIGVGVTHAVEPGDDARDGPATARPVHEHVPHQRLIHDSALAGGADRAWIVIRYQLWPRVLAVGCVLRKDPPEADRSTRQIGPAYNRSRQVVDHLLRELAAEFLIHAGAYVAQQAGLVDALMGTNHRHFEPVKLVAHA